MPVVFLWLHLVFRGKLWFVDYRCFVPGYWIKYVGWCFVKFWYTSHGGFWKNGTVGCLCLFLDALIQYWCSGVWCMDTWFSTRLLCGLACGFYFTRELPLDRGQARLLLRTAAPLLGRVMVFSSRYCRDAEVTAAGFSL